MVERVPMTVQGCLALQEELKHLKQVRRPRVIEAISTARAHGDLSENAEYHAAKEEQGFIEGRIRDIEDKIGRAQVIDPATVHASKVVFGATVTLLDLESNDEVIYQIVGLDEADIAKRKVSVTSPIARAMLGKDVGDTAQVQAPGGVREYEIVGIEYK